MVNWNPSDSRWREVDGRLPGVTASYRRDAGAWVAVTTHDRNTDVTPPPPPPVPTMRIGLKTLSSSSEGVTQMATDWNNAVATFGPMNYSRGLYYGATEKLPTQPQYFTPAGTLQIPSFRNTDFSSIASFMRNMRGPEKLITFHHEPEADYINSGGGPTFVRQFRAAYDAVKAANPDVQLGMAAGGYQYNAGQHGADGSFIPPPDKCDFYSIDTYRGGQSTGNTGFGALVGLPQVDEFQTWYGFVKNLGKPLYVTEYGRGFTYSAGQKTSTGATWTSAQVSNVLAKRPQLMTDDYTYLKGLGFKGLLYWWNNYSPGDDWQFTDQPSIDSWSAIVAAETSP